MSFCVEWDSLYQSGKHQTKWPMSDVVSYTMRYLPKTQKRLRVLELGCGTGANISFYLSLGADYFAVEGSATAVEQVIHQYPHLVEQIRVGDFTREIPFDGPFDIVLDRAALCCNRTTDIVKTISRIQNILAVGGIFIGVSWMSTSHPEYERGVKIEEDPFCRTSYEAGPFAGIGLVNFFDLTRLKSTFSSFTMKALDLVDYRSLLTGEVRGGSWWNLVCSL